jgi:hypothetical protein
MSDEQKLPGRLYISPEVMEKILGAQGQKPPPEGHVPSGPLKKPEPIMTLADLRRPEPECQLPEPVRTPENEYPKPTCPHCGLVFMLVTDSKGTYWVSKADHEVMIRQQEQKRSPERRHEEFSEEQWHPYA